MHAPAILADRNRMNDAVLSDLMTHSIENVDVLGSSMEVFLFFPDATEPRPAIVLAQHIPVGHTGLENDIFTLKTAERFAKHGFVVAVPFIFHWWPKSEDIQIKRSGSRDERMLADIKAAFDLLSHRDEVNRNIGIVGHCWGGRVAWLGASHIPELKACAMFYGGRIKVPMGEDNPPPIELAGNIKCPVAGFYGNEDQSPSTEDVDDYSAALETAGVEHTFYRYDGAGHAFQNFPSPERFREEQSEDAWKKVLAFMADNLN